MSSPAMMSSTSARAPDDQISYSDFMRSLAAKYNNNNNNSNSSSNNNNSSNSSNNSSSSNNNNNGSGVESRHLESPLSSVLGGSSSSTFHGLHSSVLGEGGSLALPLLASLAAGKSAFSLFPGVSAPGAAAAALLNTMLASSSLLSPPLPQQAPPPPPQASKPLKRSAESSSSRGTPSISGSHLPTASKRFCPALPCSEASRAVQAWTVNEVCEFVESFELLRPSVGVFREQSIDGLALLLLTEDHLLSVMKLKLGPVLKFKAALASRIGSCPACLHCLHCHSKMSSSSNSASSSSAPKAGEEDAGSSSKDSTFTPAAQTGEQLQDS